MREYRFKDENPNQDVIIIAQPAEQTITIEQVKERIAHYQAKLQYWKDIKAEIKTQLNAE